MANRLAERRIVGGKCWLGALRSGIGGLSGKADTRTHGVNAYEFRHLEEPCDPAHHERTGTCWRCVHDHERCWSRCCADCAEWIRSLGKDQIRSLRAE